MNIINILDKQTIDKIAAGEVVDRPSSIVKELCENAIDAKATSVSIEINDGGTTLIRITDNGVGVPSGEVKKAFLRHATSKIETSSDLSFIKTLGFRGEALSSIAAVSKLEFCTKTKEELTGSIYKIHGGEEILFEEAGLPEGTTVIVKDLFYNTPARLKFLKSAKTEAAYISEIIEKTALAHPEISFKFRSNNSIRLSTSGNGDLKDAIYAVYGKDITERLLKIDEDRPLLSVRGFIAQPEISRGNRNYENYFINGRYIKDKVVEAAIEDAYKGFQMKGTFPFTAFNILIEPELIDVNVHPSKMEIRFFDNQKIYDSLFEIISNTLDKASKIPEVRLETDTKEAVKHEDIPEPFEEKRKLGASESLVLNTNSFNEETAYKADAMISGDISGEHKDVNEMTDDNIAISVSNKPDPDLYVDAEQETLFKEEFLSKKARPDHRIVGYVFDTYWIVEYDGSMYIIDQHAAHEKVLYEELLEKIEKNENYSQKLMPPFIISLNMSQEEALSKCLSQFTQLGFVIEPFGEHDYQISEVPMSLYGINTKEHFLLMLDELSELRGKQSFEVLLDKVATASCKAAVKGGGRISVSEADALIDRLLSLDNPYNCPHGRPTMITMTKSELEKKFKRIV